MKITLAQVKNLTARYGSVTAADNISFELYQGEILAVIGPNGSGKTTTVECLEGLRRCSAGEITFLGQNPRRKRREIYQKVGVQLQDTEYPEKIKVKELCTLFSSFYENPADWRLLLEQLGLAEKAGRKVKNLSGGEKQRLSILLALLPRPKVLILDELTTGLDPEIRHGLWESLKQIKKAGVSILLISHYLEEVEALADRLIYLKNGKCLFTGTKQEFGAYARENIPASKQKEPLSLEQLYLLLTPGEHVIDLKTIL